MTETGYPEDVGRGRPLVTDKPLVQYATRLPEDQVAFLRALGRGSAAEWLREIIGRGMRRKRRPRKKKP